jgi:hypothetical protein
MLAISFTVSKTRNVLLSIEFIGATVTLTSIGAGALGTVTLFFLPFGNSSISWN